MRHFTFSQRYNLLPNRMTFHTLYIRHQIFAAIQVNKCTQICEFNSNLR